MAEQNHQPIRRHESLKPLSREHHFGLLFSWKIRKGFTNNIDIKRVKKYADWFFENHQFPHFETEEKLIFPVLGEDHELVKKAKKQRRRIKKLFNGKDPEKSLSLLEEELEHHIRFEERKLFKEVQQKATEEQLKAILEAHNEHNKEENYPDPFWEE